MEPLVDTHCHLDGFEDLDAVLERARAAGVQTLVHVGCVKALDEVDASLALAQKIGCYATVGVHPHDASTSTDAILSAIERVARDPRIVAIGEMGLDHHYDHSPRELQAEVFRRQIAIARALSKPIVIHTRNAPAETLAILREENARDVGGIIHCFSEDRDFASRALDLGFCASFSGLVTFPKKAEAIREAAKHQPADAILVETDAPYLAPVPHRGKRNEPSYVAHTARAVAELRGVADDELRRITTANARRVLRLAGESAPPSA
jgi:TatD DNase family protein